MPELPEVEVVRRGLAPLLIGQSITDFFWNGRALRQQPVNAGKMARLIVGNTVREIGRRAKYLQIIMTDNALMIIHLGMTGRLGLFPASKERTSHDHLIWTLDGGMELRFNDPRRFGAVHVLAPTEEFATFQTLGPEPFSQALTADYLTKKAKNRQKPVKNFLMDNQIVVGIGNIYASEILFDAGIRPQREAGKITPRKWQEVITVSRSVLQRAINAGGTTIADFVNASGDKGYFQLELNVYGREGKPCVVCLSPIRKKVMAGRATYWCAKCQR